MSDEERTIPRKIMAGEIREVVERSHESDLVNDPPHYKLSKMECADIIDMLDLPRWIAFAFKHIYRRGYKDKGYSKEVEIEDLQKAIWYINHHIKNLKAEEDEIRF